MSFVALLIAGSANALLSGGTAWTFAPVVLRSRARPIVLQQMPDPEKRMQLEEALRVDVERFRAESADKAADEEGGLLQGTISVLGTVLTYNFFIICGFFAWFLTGVGAQYGVQNEAIINAFRGCWDFLIQPLLGTHMVLTFLAAGLERVAKGERA
uniref:Uncharacterized protein n=1 Tax=Coccolithus braarudii TaxID=221442 RepID=A0A7S0LML8_9EUKA|mmetsp:Transcript_48670/g.103854  ORF Transcript_48670/g.103854 Transcript_48670/m.103854 type:complete len:156 (+) Transcript_48670:22-489(+)|eukprot:CAMPEP_0183347460 /NCGR_PEP_ID=MMETSP0164_2-20130417/12277_1 /TAXON_ID=221442 /ORGANISM="Coccolithus pelagicus ssp braarudi, Strain PLY182g" /LENGTH=155 /DNA_ID=CAMNT_0025518887 /DNA_START=29 /DNA_END=496 /DNA_ORIENTATION=-